MNNKEYKGIISYLKSILIDSKFENKVYAVGGCVRDSLLGKPISDIDIFVDLENGGIELSNYLLKKDYLKFSPVLFKTYGTSMFTLVKFPSIEIEAVPPKFDYEKEGEIIDKMPDTSISKTLIIDSIRRDFTFNSLYENIFTNEILDPTSKGINDLKNKEINFATSINDSLTVDPLRMLRAIRFVTKGFKLKEECINYINSNAELIKSVSIERITSELNLILQSESPSVGIKLLNDCGLLKIILPEIYSEINVFQNKFHGDNDVFSHTLKVVENLKGESLKLLWAGLLHDVGKPITQKVVDGVTHFITHEIKGAQLTRNILKRLKFPNDFIDDVSTLVLYHMSFPNIKTDTDNIKPKRLRKLQYTLGKENFFDLLKLVDADNYALDKQYAQKESTKKIKEDTLKMIDEGLSMFEYKLPVTGDDIMEIKNLTPGPKVKEYQQLLLKIAYSNPKLTKEELINQIINVKL